jgi:hypothetical protein
MIRIGKYKYLVDLQENANLQSTSAFFILEFEYDNKVYIGWTGERRTFTVKNKIERLIYNVFHDAARPNKNNPDLAKAITESKYITVSTEEIPMDLGLMSIYLRMYELIDEYIAYAPYGHNIINSLNKCAAEKAVITGYAAKWGIPETIYRAGTNSVRSYPHRAVYQYKQMTDNLYKLYKKWDSIREYIESMAPMKINPSAIYMCCNGQRRIAYDCIWRFDGAEEIIEIAPDMRKVKTKEATNIEKDAENRVAKFMARQAKIANKLETGKSRILR